MSKKRVVIAIVAVIALISILGVCLVACNSADNFKKKLEKKGYTVVERSAAQIQSASRMYGQIEWEISAVKINGEYDEESVVITKFKKSSDAKKYYKMLEIRDGLFEEEIGERDADLYCKGTLVMSGTKQGVKDAK